MSEIIRFEMNVPEEVALVYPQGVATEGRYGPQVMFTFEGDRRAYVPPVVAEKITQLGLRVGERFVICKREVKNGRSRGVQWEITRAQGAAAAATGTARPAETGPRPVAAVPITDARDNQTEFGLALCASAMAACLRAAVDALQATERYAKGKDWQLEFEEEDVRTLATSIFIHSTSERQRTRAVGGAA